MAVSRKNKTNRKKRLDKQSDFYNKLGKIIKSEYL